MNALGRKMNGNICELYFKFNIVNKKVIIKDRGRFLIAAEHGTAGAGFLSISLLFRYANIYCLRNFNVAQSWPTGGLREHPS